jgi:hypothetical protein
MAVCSSPCYALDSLSYIVPVSDLLL